MSASITPTASPRLARAAARLTVTLDLPTPPLPLATAYTLVREPGWANGMTGSAAAEPPRSVACKALRCSSDITPKSMLTEVIPGILVTAAVMSVVSLSRRGQPATVSRSSTLTWLSATVKPLTMPRSVIGRRISGSSTVASAAWIASSSVGAGADIRSTLLRG
jgi:hypothetical protein